MAFRIGEHLERAELDNRLEGRVTGRLWLRGLNEPLELELEGNPWRDIAGYRILIAGRNPKPVKQDTFEHVAKRQVGVVGDITASRKVRMPDAPMEEFIAAYKTGRKFTFHQANCLYLEWYSQFNGRVVIETTEFDLKLDGEPTWRMTEKEENAQRVRNEGAILSFMNRLVGAESDPAADEDYELHEEEDRPTSTVEADAEAETARMNLLLDRVESRLQHDGRNPGDFERVYEEERERLRRERGEPEPEPLSPEQEAERAAWIDEMNLAAQEAIDNGEDMPERQEHPLVKACSDLGCRIHHTIEEHGWLPEHATQEHPLLEISAGISIASAKLAGALNGQRHEEWPPDSLFAGDTLVRLKKARSHLRDALAGLAAAEEARLADSDWRSQTRLAIQGFLAHVNRLIQEVRDSLA